MVKKYIERKTYTRRVSPYIDKDVIKVIVGQRRVGKSYLLFQIMDLIREKKRRANIIYINKELEEFRDIHNADSLLEYVKQRTVGRGKQYLFIDEVQEIEGFEKALRSLLAKGGYDIYCTGSNANMLSSDIASSLSGRYVEIRVYSLSYPEFLQFHKLVDSDENFLKYIKYGGLPYLKNLPLEDEVVYGYLKSVYDTVVLKDVVVRYKVRNVSFLSDLIFYLASEIGTIVSAKKISDFLKSQRIKISPNLVLTYLSYLENAFVVFRCPRIDLYGRKIFEVNHKYYFEDIGIRHSIVSYKHNDINKVLENLVHNHLLYLGYSVKVGQLRDREIDFVAERMGRRVYIQVAYLITDENRNREFGNLMAIKDNYPKIVVSMDRMLSSSEYKGILHLPIREFLLSDLEF